MGVPATPPRPRFPRLRSALGSWGPELLPEFLRPTPPLSPSSRPERGPAPVSATVEKATPRPPAVTPRSSAAERLEVVRVPASGARIPSITNDSLQWRKERAAPGSPYAEMGEGDTLPGPRDASKERAPKLHTGRHRAFASKAQWRKFFADPLLRKWADAKARATKGGPKIRYRRLPERKRPPGAGSLR
ncbi:MAG TPA: hypothetical protein VFW96_26465 [Thermomicrobiales bacterium]|nr:hypothetical protein [Thermomicrobiales bacterium]